MGKRKKGVSGARIGQKKVVVEVVEVPVLGAGLEDLEVGSAAWVCALEERFEGVSGRTVELVLEEFRKSGWDVTVEGVLARVVEVSPSAKKNEMLVEALKMMPAEKVPLKKIREEVGSELGLGAVAMRKVEGGDAGGMREEVEARMEVEKKSTIPRGKKRDLRVGRVWDGERVVCEVVETGLEVVCWVKDSANLMSGMILKGADCGVFGRWSYLGKLPRRRGRW